MKLKSLELDIFEGLFKSVCEEMGIVLIKSSSSVNIKERKDASCALFDKDFRLISQAEHIPVHIGSMNFAVKGVINTLGHLNPGDIAIVNNPYMGGTHLPDVTVIKPVYYHSKSQKSSRIRGKEPNKKQPVFYLAVRAHFSDIGGNSAGSVSVSTDINEEGIIIPPVKLYDSGKLNKHVLDLIIANIRDPDIVTTDISSMVASLNYGESRITEIINQYSLRKVLEFSSHVLKVSENKVIEQIKTLTKGRYTFTDYMDDDGLDRTNIKIKCTLTVGKNRIKIDFTGSDMQTNGNINCVFPVTASSCMYVIRTLIKENIPINSGIMNPVDIVAPDGSIVNSRYPAACSAGNVETSQRIVDVVYGAFAKASSGTIPAASCGSMNNISFGGINKTTGQRFMYYETNAGGMGATPNKKGESAMHMHMTNTMNTPVEVLEKDYPVLISFYKIRRGSGGKGKYYGGNGIYKSIIFHSPVNLSVISERRTHSPYGLNGGQAGKKGLNHIVLPGGKKKKMPAKFTIKLPENSQLNIKTPGGGGYGKYHHLNRRRGYWKERGNK